jgi:transcriptional regulator with GAF, ATPase, and Fis domain
MPTAVATVSGDESVEELRRELTEAREQQAATAEILRVISSSPMDLPHVFAEIATSAARLCDAYDAVILQVEGDLLQLVAHHGPISLPSSFPLSREISIGRAVLDRRTIHIADLQAEIDEYPEGSDRARRDGVNTVLNVPLIRAGKTIGVIGIRRTEVRLFSDRQIALLQTFANQAVIAIENARLFEEVQARTRELQQSLEYQAATSDVLNVISRSPNALQPVLGTILATAQRLCGTDRGSIWILQDDEYRLAASIGIDKSTLRYFSVNPISPSRLSLVGRVALLNQTVHVPNVLENVELTFAHGRPTFRPTTMLGVPL